MAEVKAREDGGGVFNLHRRRFPFRVFRIETLKRGKHIMNRDIMKAVFPEELELIDAGKCPSCRMPPWIDQFGNLVFKDKLSLEEYKISGLCQDCQDAVFTSPAVEL